MSDVRNFHLRVTNTVDRILLFTPQFEFINEMVLATPESMTPLAFNGTLPAEIGAVRFLFLGGEGQTSYCFNDIFSKPLTRESLSERIWPNYICVNAPPATQFALVEFPETWRNFFRLPPIEFLERLQIEGLNPHAHNSVDSVDSVDSESNTGPETQAVRSDLIKKFTSLGIDPTAATFTRGFDLVRPSKEYADLCGESELDLLFAHKIVVKCYMSMLAGVIEFVKVADPDDNTPAEKMKITFDKARESN
jgi:hypothetical protein